MTENEGGQPKIETSLSPPRKPEYWGLLAKNVYPNTFINVSFPAFPFQINVGCPHDNRILLPCLHCLIYVYLRLLSNAY